MLPRRSEKPARDDYQPNLSRILRLAESEESLIARHGKALLVMVLEAGPSTAVAFDHFPLGADAAVAVPAWFAAGL